MYALLGAAPDYIREANWKAASRSTYQWNRIIATFACIDIVVNSLPSAGSCFALCMAIGGGFVDVHFVAKNYRSVAN
jgi:hypothetical protein